MKMTENIFGRKIKGTRVLPIVSKIIVVFTLFLLVSNFATNYINLMLNRGELIKFMNQLLVKDLKELYLFSTNQFEIYIYNRDFDGAVKSMEEKALRELKGEKSVALGVLTDGSILFQSSKSIRMDSFEDREALEQLKSSLVPESSEGSFTFWYRGEQFFGVYKYNAKWEAFLIRAEELNEFYQRSRVIFRNISIIIMVIAIICTIVGIFLIRYVLRFVKYLTRDIMKMQDEQKLELVDLSKAPNDDVTFLGVAFNALANTIDNLMNIFKKFVAKDVVVKAYREKEIRLEGSKMELAILFSDIKSFTFMTETLGTDIINLLNLHYNRAIRHIHEHDGIVGSIIGDALLAVFGVLAQEKVNKSHQAVLSAYDIQDVASSLRQEMHRRREEIIKTRGGLTKEEESVYRAVLLEVGVGIDGGEVFYGNIGSYERMTNTVIGDNVNSASRLEGLTRIYQVPVICSDFVKDEIDREKHNGVYFLEIDQVRVKGKTESKRIYWPIKKENFDDDLQKNAEIFSQGLKAYYDGDWVKAHDQFKRCALPLAEVFKTRTESLKSPKDWSGVWTATTK